MEGDEFDQLQRITSQVYQGSSILINSWNSDNTYRLSSYTSSSTKFINERKAIVNDDDIISQVFYRLISSNKFNTTGWFVLLFSCKLITQSLRNDLPIFAITRGFSIGSRAANLELTIQDSLPCASQLLELRWSDLRNVLCIIRTSLSSRHVLQLTEKQLDSISISLLKAFLSSIDSGSKKCSILYQKAFGMSIENIIVLEDALLMDIPIPSALISRKSYSKNLYANQNENLIVAIFENSLELSEFPNFSFEILENKDNEQNHVLDSVKSLEYRFLEKMADIIIRSKITLVACQRRIHPYLIRILSGYGILCLPRLSIRYCGALQRLCGARQLVSFPTSRDSVIEASSLGYLASVEYKIIYGRKYVVARARLETKDCNDYEYQMMSATLGHCIAGEIQQRKSLMSTIVLTAPSEALCNELETALEDVTYDLTSLLDCPYVLPGAGLWQTYTAQEIRLKLSSQLTEPSSLLDNRNSSSFGNSSEIMKATKIYIDCLEECGRIVGGFRSPTTELINNQETEQEEFVVPINASCSEILGEFLFVNPVKDCAISASNIDVEDDTHMIEEVINQNRRTNRLIHADALEALVPNKNALLLAVEAALCILDIDGVLTSYPKEIMKNY
mmetsp:Transcript_7582/g.7677  ORF Transcript_7582/g.7677 Transcript_7582/m.7677 type:complete len:620 (-) Transcript_7582:316-2175(-)